MDYVIAFVVGGLICALAQFVLDTTKLQPGNIMVGLVCIGALLGFTGVYEPFKEWAKAGASVPLLGFGNTLFQGIKEGIAQKGFLGLFTGGFTAAAAGIAGALIIGYLSSFIFNPKMK